MQFVDRAEIDPRYFERPLYLTPIGDVSTEGYVVIREALRASGSAAIGRIPMQGRDRLIAVSPLGRGLLVEALRYCDELRPPERFFGDIPEAAPDPEAVALAAELIDARAARFDPGAFRDAYAEALRELVERKRAGQAIVSPPRAQPKRGAVVNLIEALKKSISEQPAPRRGKR